MCPKGDYMKKTNGPNLVKTTDKIKEKAKKIKGNIQISVRKTWFSEAMSELDKQDKDKK